MMDDILVIAHILDGRVKKGTHSAVTFASSVADHLNCTYSILALGDDLSTPRDILVSLGAQKVILGEAPGLDQALAERWAPIIEQVVKEGSYGMVVSPSSTTAKDVLPRLAHRLEAGMASDVIDVTFQGDTLHYTRPMYAGNINATVEIVTDRHVVTVRQTEFPAFEPLEDKSPLEVIPIPPPPSEVLERITFESFERAVSERPDLTEAKVVVSGGRGLKSSEGFRIIEELADLLGGAVGASRAAVDSGFINSDFQVGQTGKIVSPELYIAVGISGAVQHLAGMKSSKVIVAINRDEDAPIFQVADFGFVGDLFKAVPEMISQIKNLEKE
jgi:electron transfer flavoprotein alpha subunit